MLIFDQLKKDDRQLRVVALVVLAYLQLNAMNRKAVKGHA